jgi:uncharacterized protein
MSTPNWHERPTVFECDGDRLIGVVTAPEHPIETGVVIIVGGPQYRAGSHRQFTLLARQLAEHSIASFRFDYRGMGDSEGDSRNFEVIQDDIRAAIDAFMTQSSNIKQVVLWGLCDAASAALYYGHTDPRVKGMTLLNPWVHTEAGAARARLKHYYLARLFSGAFWSKLFSGKIKISASLGEVANSARLSNASQDDSTAKLPTDPRHGSPGYIDRMLRGLKQFRGGIQFILSGQDLTAQEFATLVKQNKNWRQACNDPRRKTVTVKEANHTFSCDSWRRKVESLTTQWLDDLNTHF